MENWKLSFVLLLPLTACFDSEVTVVKTIGREPDITPICSNVNIILLVCKIRPESSSEECRLRYQYGRDFEHKCDSRLTLMMENQTVFLHLTNLTPVDSGTYTCECSYPGGTDILHLNITVEEEEHTSSSNEEMKIQAALIGVTIVFIIATVIFGFIHRSIRQGRRPEPPSNLPNMEPEDIQPYSTFTQRENGLYSTTRVYICNTNTNNSSMSTTEETLSGKLL